MAVGIENQFNIGNILRCSEAVGSKYVYFVNTTVQSHKKINQLSRNTMESVPHAFLSSSDFFLLIPRLPQLIAVEITTQSSDIFTTDFPKNVGFVVGAESKGVPPEILEVCESALHIPMMGVNSSLNVASALCVALYAWHQRFRY